ncbi:MAG: multidrug transporter, partial [Cyanobacteria bacterium J06659_2]
SIRNFQLVRNLQVGGRVYAWIEADTNPNALMLPIGAILPSDQKFYAFVVNEENGMVERREVQRGIQGLNGVEILSGIEPGELVVTEGINRLVDGTLVEVVSEEAAL